MEERTLTLTNNSNGFLHHLNFPREMPQNVDYVQHLVVPLGEVITLELHGVVLSADNCAGESDDDEVGNERVVVEQYPDGDRDSVNGGNGQRVTVATATASLDKRTATTTTTTTPPMNDGSNNLLEIYDNYADVNGTKWILCAKRDHRRHHRLAMGSFPIPAPVSRASAGGQRHPFEELYGDYGWGIGGDTDRDSSSPVFITSYLNTLHIRQRGSGTSLNQKARRIPTTIMNIVRLNATIKVYEDKGYRPKLASKDVWVESCQPNPCQFGGKCVDTGATKKCECPGHYSGRFCGLTICDFDPCLFGTCELTATSFKCNCLPGYLGSTCEQKRRPCAENPCQGRGDCFEKSNNGFFCR